MSCGVGRTLYSAGGAGSYIIRGGRKAVLLTYVVSAGRYTSCEESKVLLHLKGERGALVHKGAICCIPRRESRVLYPICRERGDQLYIEGAGCCIFRGGNMVLCLIW